MGSDPIPVQMDDIYQHLLNHVLAYEHVSEEYDPCCDKKDTRNAAIFTFVLTHWSQFFKEIFNADTPLRKLWCIYEHISTFTEEYKTLCKAHPGIFLYMHDVLKKCVDETEKKNAQLLLENIEFMSQNLRVIPHPDWPEEDADTETGK